MEELNLVVNSSPHLRDKDSTASIMRDVVIALTPAGIYAVYLFGVRALYVIAVSVAACVVSEYISCKVMKKKVSIYDWSAVVTGILLAYTLPPTVPLWLPLIGGAFAIVIVKMLFGGIGYNFVNPALAARAFLAASWPVLMTTWIKPGMDAVSGATPLALIKKGGEAAGGALPSLMDLFIGNVGGSLGETSAVLLLIGGIYLILRKVITPEIPVMFIGTVAVMTWLLGGNNGLFTGDFLYHILAGGLFLGAFFMATDYTTSPVTFKGRIIMGIGCGIITAVIRLYGGYPEGVCYSILLMNVAVPLIDKYTIPRKFGGVSANA